MAKTFPIHVRTGWLDYSPALHSHVRTRVEAALRAFASHIRWVAVRVGPGPGRRRSCDIEVVLAPAVWVPAFDEGEDAYTAVDAAARAARRVVGRELRRAREVVGETRRIA
jgi:ribosome-associated translation inhibitor RaiA